MGLTKIEWADRVWNPITGCSSVSEGCQNCYAKRMANRLKGRYGYPKDEPFKVTFHPNRLDEPLHWKKPSRIFVCSMGDLFHEDVSMETIGRILCLMRSLIHHKFLFLTKRPKRMREALLAFDMTGECNGLPYDHLLFGISVENQRTADERIPILLQIPAAKRFISCEPTLGPIDLSAFWESLPISLVIVGGETGPGYRPSGFEGYHHFALWARSLKDQCQAAGVPFFFKKMPGNQPIPKDLMVREFPNENQT
jgi:protein gp37